MSDTISPIVTMDALAAGLGEADLRLVDCRFDLGDKEWGKRVYAESHLPGARYAHLDEDLSSPATPRSGRHPLPVPQAFAALLARLSISPASRVVAYDQGNGAVASRFWWLLRAAGHRNVQVLDGGFAGWRAAGLPVTTEVPPHGEATTMTVDSFARAVGTDELLAALPSGRIRLVDARPADRFAGRNETMDPVPGHVPGAVSHPFSANVGADGRFLPAAELAARWRKTLGDHDVRDTVVMCGSGVTACHDLLALEIAGLHGAQLYPGSWSEWIRDPSRPVAT